MRRGGAVPARPVPARRGWRAAWRAARRGCGVREVEDAAYVAARRAGAAVGPADRLCVRLALAARALARPVS